MTNLIKQDDKGRNMVGNKGMQTSFVFWLLAALIIMLVALLIINSLTGFINNAGNNVGNFLRFGT
ncbi:hypothetical protein A3B57_00730 [Microgenomates group bacterium RIFCSPLOWO2_01_FULL_47_10]|nr:MAG: hypothetical protein A3B57_00730 [Microgenomates group bacterium RIFCSPLOWO2_01_FULL_47_10]